MKNIEQSPEQKSELGEIIDRIDKTNVVVYEKLNASNDKAAKAEFLENPDLVHPNNEYGNLDEKEVRKNLEELKSIEHELGNSSFNDKEKLLATIIIEDNKKKNEFLAANLAYNEASTPEEKTKAAEWHREANANLYGEPDEGVFQSLLKEKIAGIDIKHLSDEERNIYNRLIERIGPLDKAKDERFRPKPETVKQFSSWIKEDFFNNLLDHVPKNQEKFSSEEAAKIINEILETEFGPVDIGWHAEVNTGAPNASASKGVITFPSNATYSKERLSALIVHELGTHAMRAIPYQSQELKVFATGLPGSETFDEGVAGCVEQALKGEYSDFGVDHYINIGLATFKDMNFREVYNFQVDLKRLTGGDPSKVINQVQRCFRGTGELPNNKDLAYYNGLNRVWRYIEEHLEDPNLFENLFLSGKTDIENPEQERLIYELQTKGSLR